MATATKCASPRYWHKKWPEPMAQSKPKPDDVRYYRPEEIPGMVLGEAHFTDFSFEPHFHLDYHIGLIAEGAQRQRFAGQTGLLGAGRRDHRGTESECPSDNVASIHGAKKSCVRPLV